MTLDDRKHRILDLRAQAARSPRNTMYLHLAGPLLRKGPRGTAQKQRLRELIANEVRDRSWKYAPRARIAVSFCFFRSAEAANLPQLAKFYLDLLSGIAFNDDRQVHLLYATSHLVEAGDEKLYLQFERLSSWNRRVAVVEDIASGFGEDDYGEDINPWAFALPWESRERHQQAELLATSRIQPWENAADIPDPYLRRLVSKVIFSEPMTIQLGGLPKRGESDAYKARLARVIQDWAEKWSFGDIRVPIELDVRVTPLGHGIAKDLDNIVLDFIPFFNALVENEGGLTGFRVWVGEVESADPGQIFVKVMPKDSIDESLRRMDRLLERGYEWESW